MRYSDIFLRYHYQHLQITRKLKLLFAQRNTDFCNYLKLILSNRKNKHQLFVIYSVVLQGVNIEYNRLIIKSRIITDFVSTHTALREDTCLQIVH